MAIIKLKKIIKPVLEILVLGLSIFFIGKFLWGSWPDLASRIEYAKIGYLWLALPFFLSYFFLRSLGWWYILKKLGGKLNFSKSGYIWFISEFSRYIPGNVWSFVGRVYLCDKEKIAKRIASLSLLLEIFYLIGTSLGLGIIVFMAGGHGLKMPLWSLIFIFPIVITIINPKILGKIINFAFYKWKKEKIDFNLGYADSIVILLVYTSAWLAYGFGSYLTAAAFVNLSGISIFWLSCSFVLAWAIGYLSFVTPMGLGVREAAIVTILKSVISSSLASLVAISTRLMMMLSEFLALLFILSAKKISKFSLVGKANEYIKKNPHSFYLALMISIYIAYFLTLTFMRHSNYLTSRYDLGNMDQTVWNTAYGNFFQLTNPEIGSQVSRFSIHGDIFLVLLAPFYWLASSPYTLLFIQTIVVALGALPIFWLAKDVLKNNKLALTMAFAYLMYPGTQWANIFDFHSITLATSFLSFAFYYVYKKNYVPFIIFCLLALATKETIAFIIILFSLYIIIRQKNWKVGIAIGSIAMLWFALLLGKIMPEARIDATSHFGLVYYKNFGNTPLEIIKHLVLQPMGAIRYIGANNRWFYLILVTIPTGFLSLFSPYIILAIPPIALNILSDQTQMRMINYQYTSDIAPFIIISSIFGLRFLIKTLHNRIKIGGKQISIINIEKIALVYTIIGVIYSSVIYSPMPYSQARDLKPFTYRNTSKKYLDELRRTIPKTAIVSATNRISPHFTNRKISYLFPNGIGQADYIIVEDGYEFELISTQNVSDNLTILRNDKRYTRIYNNDNVEVFRKDAK